MDFDNIAFTDPENSSQYISPPDNNSAQPRPKQTLSKPRPSRQTACDACRIRRVKCDATARKSQGLIGCTQCNDRSLECTFNYRHSPKVIKPYRGQRIEQVRRLQKQQQQNPYQSPGKEGSPQVESSAGLYWELPDAAIKSLANSGRYGLAAREVFYPVLAYVRKGRRSKLLRKTLACLGALYTNDASVLGCNSSELQTADFNAESNPNGAAVEAAVIQARLRIYAALYSQVLHVIEKLFASQQPTDSNILLSVVLFSCLPTPANVHPKVGSNVLIEWVQRRIYLEHHFDQYQVNSPTSVVTKRVVYTSMYMDAFTALFSGTSPSVRPEDILLPNDMLSWESHNPQQPQWRPHSVSCDPALATKDTCLIVYHLFANLLCPRARLENQQRSPTLRLEQILGMLASYASFHRELFSLADKPPASVPQEDQIYYWLNEAAYCVLVVRFWEAAHTARSDAKSLNSSEQSRLDAVMERITKKALRTCLDMARTIEYVLSSGMVQYGTEGNLRNALEYDLVTGTIMAVYAIRSLRVWAVTVSLENIVSWFGVEYSAYPIDRAITLFLKVLELAGKTYERAEMIRVFYTSSDSVLRENNTMPQIVAELSVVADRDDPCLLKTVAPFQEPAIYNISALSPISPVGDPYNSSLEHVWETVEFSFLGGSSAMNTDQHYADPTAGTAQDLQDVLQTDPHHPADDYLNMF
ncbi:hypothetical protein TRVA0_094S00100 [Trichomonascus vanleenenianus]|uniref:Zn(II)2Cys6 transcription factor domain-containing protein n=1 Tax=Trichomonascus vanleenenianus TaxID=2268995 RepID=UPI003ECB75EC